MHLCRDDYILYLMMYLIIWIWIVYFYLQRNFVETVQHLALRFLMDIGWMDHILAFDGFHSHFDFDYSLIVLHFD
jgi:hypothetical protein